MNIAKVLEWIAGLALAGVTLQDVFGTVVVTGSSRGFLRVSRRLVLAAVPLWHRSRDQPLALGFAPSMLLASFVTWMLLLLLAVGLMAHACRDAFTPSLQGFGHALYVAGGAMTTIGFGTTEANGLAAVVVIAGGFCGLAVMTMAVTYLLEVQSNIAQRDALIIELRSSAGDPPSALAVMEQYAELDCRDQLHEVLEQGRRWCGHVLQSHVSHPSLIYFRSPGTESGWPGTLGTLLDLALVHELLVHAPERRGPAVLLRRQAYRLGSEVSGLVGLTPQAEDTTTDQVHELVARLLRAGYKLRDDADPAQFARMRAEQNARIHPLSRHLGTAPTPLLPDAVAGRVPRFQTAV